MITELSIEGFKSFGSPEQNLALGPLNFVVGANASGESNLLAALRFLRDAVMQDAEYAVAEHGGIAEVHEGEWAFQILEDGIRGAINPSSVSDGTIRLLTFMVIANWTSKHRSLVAIEEPENGIHPHLSEHLVGILRQAAKDQQIIVTSHNPAFLDHLQPEEIILCDKVEGFTSLRRASDIPEIKDFQKRFRLGDLWVQGVLGGIP